jgi:predicted ferric reductase
VKRQEYDIQIFIGLGIGVTPFFASLRSYVGMLHE